MSDLSGAAPRQKNEAAACITHTAAQIQLFSRVRCSAVKPPTRLSTMASAMPAAAETSLRLGTRFVDGESAAAESATVHGFNRLLCLLRRSHGNKTKSSGTPADPVNHQIRFHYGAVRCKSVVQLIFRCVKREVSNKQLRVHVMYYYALLELPLRLPDCSRPPGFRSSPNRVRLKILHAVDSNSYRADARKVAHPTHNATKIFKFFRHCHATPLFNRERVPDNPGKTIGAHRLQTLSSTRPCNQTEQVPRAPKAKRAVPHFVSSHFQMPCVAADTR